MPRLSGCSGLGYRAADDQRLAQSRIELGVARVWLDDHAVQGLREEAVRGGREDDVHDVRVREAEVAQALEIGLRDRGRVVHHPLREVITARSTSSRPAPSPCRS